MFLATGGDQLIIWSKPISSRILKRMIRHQTLLGAGLFAVLVAACTGGDNAEFAGAGNTAGQSAAENGTGGANSMAGAVAIAGGSTAGGVATAGAAGGAAVAGAGAGAGAGGMAARGGSTGAGGTAGNAAGSAGSAGNGSGGQPVVPPAKCTAVAAVPALKQTSVAQTGAAMHMTGVPGEDTLYVLERGGKLRVVANGKLLDAPLLTVTPGGGTERGALSIALHPKFAENKLIYVTYTAGNGDTTIDAFHRTSDTAAELVKNIYKYAHSAVIHQGGMAEFGPDGYLYLSVGDNGENGKPSQMAASRLGKILRMDADTGMPAPGNVADYTWHMGLRNPWRWSFDRGTGDMYIGHVGQSAFESIDYAPAGAKGLNFGWPMDEGVCSGGGVGGPGPTCGAGVTSAILQYGGGQKAIIGGYVYRGAKIPGLCGRYFYADHIMGFVHSFVVTDGKVTDERNHPELATGGQVVSFGEDGAGELYIVRINGLVSRIDAK
jgi:glucose/arabinose dehydrogenase